MVCLHRPTVSVDLYLCLPLFHKTAMNIVPIITALHYTPLRYVSLRASADIHSLISDFIFQTDYSSPVGT